MSYMPGKRNRGLSVIGSLRHLMSEDKITEETVNIALLLGWCVEWFQAFFLVADDIMDQSLTRRGQLCWYKKVAYLTSVGQSLDLITKPGNDFEHFTLNRYKVIVKYKTAFYSFYLPVALAMYMAGITDKEAHENAKAILLEMGEFFQIQDDFLDAYGDPKITGKVGTDIEENKCTWLIVNALERVSPQQLTIIKENYGINDQDATLKVKEIYKELGLDKMFHEYEESSYQKIIDLINTRSGNLPKAVFLEFVQKIYKRKK
ncbi:hypothetical protein QZH41_011041 [Actinostola sp. cb2023]|nr:hypothetical protein QZH41_011041 [Actinostola sp. cb2023]